MNLSSLIKDKYMRIFCYIHRDLFSGKNSIFNRFIEIMKDDRDTVIEVPEKELIQNADEKYNNMLASK